jgi:hypothetical protein
VQITLVPVGDGAVGDNPRIRRRLGDLDLPTKA